MAELKTKENDLSVEAFLNAVSDENKRADSLELMKMLKKITGLKPKMWGPGIVGFGSYHYKYDSGHEGDAPLIGFSPRKANISVYLACGLQGHDVLLNKLGKHKMGKGCLYINKLKDIDTEVLTELIKVSIQATNKTVEEAKKKLKK